MRKYLKNFIVFMIVLSLFLSIPFLAKAEVAEEDKYGGHFTMPITDDPPIWPLTGGLYNILVNKVVYSGLVEYDPETLEAGSGLAESWEVSEDELTWTFNLRQDVTWHDGVQFDAEDVKFTLDAWLDPDVPYYLSGNVSNIEEVEIVDSYTIKLHMIEPQASLPVLLGYLANILPEHLLEDLSPEELVNPTEFLRHPIGTGPFKFSEHVPGSHVTLEANEDYFRGRPYLDRFTFMIIADMDTQISRVLAGEMDLAVIEPHHLGAFDGRDNIRIDEADQVNHVYIAPNHKREYFEDVRVRQALTYSLDRNAIVEEILYGTAQVATGPITPLSWAYNSEVKKYPYDPDKARELLDEAGWIKNEEGIREKNGKEFDITMLLDPHPVREQVALKAQDDWSKIGINMSLEFYDYSIILDRTRAGRDDWDINVNWFITPPEPDLFSYYRTGKGRNFANYSSETVDHLLAEGRSTSDREERLEIYHELQDVLAHDAPYIYLYYPQEVRAINERVQDFASVGYRDALTHSYKIWIKN